MEKPELEPNSQLQERRKSTLEMDEESKKKRHQQGLLSARERVDKLLDQGSFIELDRYALHQCNEFGLDEKKRPGDGVITGQGMIDGRPVYIFAHDGTFFGGALAEHLHAKSVKSWTWLNKPDVPLSG